MKSDKDLLDLLLAEGRAYVAMMREAKERDALPIGQWDQLEASRLFHTFHEIRMELRAAVMDRLEAERPAA